ncbi:DNA-directed RNA polymerase III subunit RPC9-like protein, partial [Gorgonomyces haynaldii]
LSDYEVYQFIQKEKSKIRHQDYLTLVHELNEFSKRQHASLQTPEHIQQFLTKFQKYPLTKLEKLMILNQRPTNLVELAVMIEEQGERFDTAQLEAMLSDL